MVLKKLKAVMLAPTAQNVLIAGKEVIVPMPKAKMPYNVVFRRDSAAFELTYVNFSL